MKNQLRFTKLALMGLTIAAIAVFLYACQDDPSANLAKPSNAVFARIDVGGDDSCDVTDITTNTTWFRTNVYVLRGDVRVKSGATLTIQSGTVIRGHKASRGTLTVERGGKLIADGTATQPIVFTSDEPVGNRNPNDWGGINIMGEAPNNQSANATPEGYPACVTAPQYGGVNCNDYSGIIRYVRIEFGGIPVVEGNEKNGLTLYSVGDSTIVDHVQVSYGGDDGFEWFGGCVNARYLVSFANVDDDFDTDFGYAGNVQYGLAVRHPDYADISASNGFESDNSANGSGSFQTSAQFSNFTLVGPYDADCARTPVDNASPGARFGAGMHLRRNTALEVYNTLILGWRTRQVFQDASTNDPVLSHNTAIVPTTDPVLSTPPTCYFEHASNVNKAWTSDVSNECFDALACGCEAGDDLATLSELSCAAWESFPDFTPVAGADILTNGTNADAIDSWFDANTTTTTATTTFFRGALRRQTGNDNGWNAFNGQSTGWLEWDPQNFPYPTGN